MAIGGVHVGDILWSSFDLKDTAQFVLDLLVGDQLLFHNCLDFFGSRSVLRAVSQEN